MTNLLSLFSRRRSGGTIHNRQERRVATRQRIVRGHLEELEERLVMAAPALSPIGDITLPAGQTFQLPLDGLDADGDTLTFSATFTTTSGTPNLTFTVPTGNSGLRISTSIGGNAQAVDLILQLFNDLTPTTVQAITDLVNAGFYSRAALTTSILGADNDLIFTAVNEGSTGNQISISFVLPATPDTPRSLTVTANAIRVNLATDLSGNLSATNTAAAVRDLILNDPSADGVAARALVSVSLAQTNGTGVVQPFGPVNLRNRVFHRIIPDFVAQLGNDQNGGFPNAGSLVGSPPILLTELDDDYDRRLTFSGFGQLAMAKVAADDTGSGGFFITDADLVEHISFAGDAATNLFTANGHGLVNGAQVTAFAVGGTLPGGITAGSTFTVRDVTANTFALATTAGGAAIDLTSNGTGIVFRNPPRHLNFDHTIFGQLVEGFNTLENIIAVGAANGTPTSEVIVTGMDVFVDRENGVLRISAPANASGVAAVTVTANDGNGGTTTRQFNVNVVADTVNDKAFLNDVAAQATTINQPVTFTLTGTDIDSDTQTFAIGGVNNFLTGSSLVNQPDPANFTVALNTTTGVVTVTPLNNFAGTLQLIVGVRDQTARSQPLNSVDNFDTQMIEVSVAPNQAPVANAQTATVFQNTNNPITVTGSDGDAVAVQTLSFRIQTLPTNGRLMQSNGDAITTAGTNLTAAGNVTYRPDDGFLGTDSFMFRVMDNGGTTGGGMDTSPDVTVTLNVVAGAANPSIMLRRGVLEVLGGVEDNDIDISLNAAGDQILVTKDTQPVQTFALAGVRMISVDGDDGDDVITVDADIVLPAHLSGGDGDDEITGGGGDDEIRGGDGDDVLDGADGNDVVHGGFGDDEMTGGDGDDFMRGGPRGLRDLTRGIADNSPNRPLGDPDDLLDDDIMDGDDGDDVMFGGMGADEMNGGDGNDRMMGDPRPDPLNPELQNAIDDLGDDTIRGDDGDDHMWGSFGDDELEGGDGEDKLRAGRGIDALLGGMGFDVLRGGLGIDDFDLTDDEDFNDRMPGIRRGREVVTGSFEDDRLLGIRQDELPGAAANPEPAIHQDGDIDYAALGYPVGQPPTYGMHHGFDGTGTDVNPGITPRPTGVYESEQPDEDLVHNLEHGHIWISYDPAQLTEGQIERLREIVESFERLGGVILTQRAANDDALPIAVASWSRILQLATVDEAVIRDFVRTNRGHSPEGFIPMGSHDN